MSTKRRLLRWTSVALALFLGAGPLPRAAAAGNTATVSGSIVAASASSPLPDAKVHLVSATTDRAFVSLPSDARGAFSLGPVAPGTYHLAVESRGGLYTVASPIVLAPGQTRTLQLQVDPTPQPSPVPGSASKGKNVWSNPLYASLLVVGVAVVVGVIIQQTTSSSSPPIVSETNP